MTSVSPLPFASLRGSPIIALALLTGIGCGGGGGAAAAFACSPCRGTMLGRIRTAASGCSGVLFVSEVSMGPFSIFFPPPL